jgi:hypothetical protein
MSENLARGRQDLGAGRGLNGTVGPVVEKIMIRDRRSPVFVRADCPSPESGHRSAARHRLAARPRGE